MIGQTAFAKKSLLTSLSQVEAGATNDLAKSDILAALKDMGDKIRTSPASDKIFFLASDMLENSSVSSFYSRNAVRKIDPAAELKKAEAAGLIADFGGARVYVLGAGLLTEDAKKAQVYRDPQTMAALKQFWRSYFMRLARGPVVEQQDQPRTSHLTYGHRATALHRHQFVALGFAQIHLVHAPLDPCNFNGSPD
jgi:hypothetical protein